MSMINRDIMTHTNASCLKCDKVEKYMVRTGCLHFCEKCFKKEFKSEHPPTEERENYLKWLQVTAEKDS